MRCRGGWSEVTESNKRWVLENGGWVVTCEFEALGVGIFTFRVSVFLRLTLAEIMNCRDCLFLH